jgi:hypothetical protein
MEGNWVNVPFLLCAETWLAAITQYLCCLMSWLKN